MRAFRSLLVIAICIAWTPALASIGDVDAPEAQGAYAQERLAPDTEPLQVSQKKGKKKKGASGKDANRANGERVSARGLNGVIKSQPRFRGAKITSVFVRRPARTSAGYMYEVWVRSRNGSETIVYIDPTTRRILYEAPGRRR